MNEDKIDLISLIISAPCWSFLNRNKYKELERKGANATKCIRKKIGGREKFGNKKLAWK